MEEKVVPILEPNIIAIPFFNFILFAFKKAIIIAVTIDDDCVMKVNRIPIKNETYIFSETSKKYKVLLLNLLARNDDNNSIP